MISELNIDEIKDKDTSSFILKKFNDITVFEIDEVVKQKSENYTFYFIIYIRINKELEPDIIQTKFKLRRIKNIFDDCEFNIKENQAAVLKCRLKQEEYEEKEYLNLKQLNFNIIHEEREKKSNTLTIIIIADAII